MAEVVQGKAQVKASGGIRDLHSAQLMIQAGADRLGIGAAAALLIVGNGEAKKSLSDY